MELNFNVDKKNPLLPVLLILKVCHFSIRSFILTIRKENYFIWGQIPTLKIDPQRFSCWQFTPFGVTFQRVRQFSTIRWWYFSTNFSWKFFNGGLFSTLHRRQKLSVRKKHKQPKNREFVGNDPPSENSVLDEFFSKNLPKELSIMKEIKTKKYLAVVFCECFKQFIGETGSE